MYTCIYICCLLPTACTCCHGQVVSPPARRTHVIWFTKNLCIPMHTEYMHSMQVKVYVFLLSRPTQSSLHEACMCFQTQKKIGTAQHRHIYIYIYICIYSCNLSLHIPLSLCIYTYIYIYIHIYTGNYIYMYTYRCLYICIYIYMYVYMCIYRERHTYIYIQRERQMYRYTYMFLVTLHEILVYMYKIQDRT